MNVTGNIECKSTAVAAGVALLDKYDEDWWSRINLCTLEMSGCYSCILGQLFGSYSDGREALGIEPGEGDLYGFDSLGPDQDFGTLQFMWAEIIEARRATSKA